MSFCRLGAKPGRPGGAEPQRSNSGWRAATILRNPSCQWTVVGPTSSCILVRSTDTLSSVCVGELERSARDR